MIERLSNHAEYQNNPEKISKQINEYYTRLKNRQQHCLKHGQVEIQEVELTDNEDELEEEMLLFEQCLPGFKYWINEVQ